MRDSAAADSTSHVASASISGRPSSWSAFHRSLQPCTCRSTKPAGLPRCIRPCAAMSMACRSASASTSASLTSAPHVRPIRAVDGGSSCTNDDARGGVPSHRTPNRRPPDPRRGHTTRGASGKTGWTAESQRNSRAMSCAVGATGPSGGRRMTSSSVAEAHLIRQVRVPSRELRDLHALAMVGSGSADAGSCSRSHASSRGHSSSSPARTGLVSSRQARSPGSRRAWIVADDPLGDDGTACRRRRARW